MSRETFGQRFNQWLKPSHKAPALPSPIPLYQTVAEHPNPLGMLGWAMRAHPHSMPVGVSRHHQMIYTKPETSIAWVGPARAAGGKSASGTVPILMMHDGPAAVMSLRSDALTATAAMRSVRGPIMMFDPDGVGIPAGVQEVRWSLLVGADDLGVAIATCQEFVKSANVIMSSEKTAADNMHFSQLAGKILGVLCHYAAVTERAFRWVYDLVSLGDPKEFDNILAMLSQWSDQRPYRKLAGVLNQPGDRELGSIQTTLTNAMGAYDTEEALRTTDSPNFDVYEFVRGSLDEPNPWLWTSDPNTPGSGTGRTLYLIRGEEPITAAINVALVTQLIRARYRLYRDDDRAGSPDAHADVLFCLDEMANMPLPRLPEYLAAPGRGVLLTGMLQDFDQLSKWGDQGRSMLTQLQQVVIFRGERVHETLRLIEALCPTNPTERVMSSGRGEGSMLAASASPERLPGIPTYRIYSGIDDDPTTALYAGADGAPLDWIHIRPYYSDPMLLNAQIKTLRHMAWGLGHDDPRRQLPLPNLDRDGTGGAILAAGGPELLATYRESRTYFKDPTALSANLYGQEEVTV